MSEISAVTTRAFDVRVEFFSGAEPFALETLRIDVPEGADPLAAARERAEQSAYWNDRVPGLRCTIDIQPVDPDDPDPPLPASGGLGAASPDCATAGGPPPNAPAGREPRH